MIYANQIAFSQPAPDARRSKIRPFMQLVLFSIASALIVPACGREAATSVEAAPAKPEEIAAQTCAACGMVVREQPAPRGQLTHKNGKTVHLCSIGDMVHYLQAPHPEGEATSIFVESVDRLKGEDPDASKFPWIDAKQASYVLGVERSGVMGQPVLVFQDDALAQDTAKRRGGTVVSWRQLQAALLK